MVFLLIVFFCIVTLNIFEGAEAVSTKYLNELKDVKRSESQHGDVTVKQSVDSLSIEYASGTREPSKSVTDLSKSFVHLLNFKGDCDSPIQSESKISSLEEAEKACANDSSCTFLIYEPNSIILCRSPFYSNPQRQEGNKVYVKASAVAGNAIEDFEILPNAQAVCEKNQLVGEMSSALNVQDIAAACKSLKTCTFFTMSTVNRLKGASKWFENHAWFCSGEPSYVFHEGFIFGQRKTTELHFENGVKEVGNAPRPQLYYIKDMKMKHYNGPLEYEQPPAVFH